MSDSMRNELSPRKAEVYLAANADASVNIVVSDSVNKLPKDKGKQVKKRVSTWRMALAIPTASFIAACGWGDQQNFPPTPEPSIVTRSYEPLESPTPVPTRTSSPTPRQLPDAPPPSTSLKQTVTALEGGGQRNSFREEGGFTKEMFESARQSTFIIQVLGEKDVQGKKEIFGREGTAWLAQSENNTYYVVTNRHAIQFPEGEKIIGFKLWRPGLDTKKFEPTWTGIATTTEGPDVAVLKLQGDYHTTNPIKPLKYEDNVLLQKGNKILTVGFPVEFKVGKTEFDYYTLGSVMTIEDTNNPQAGDWIARGLSNSGQSGSPVAVNKEGQLVVVGVIHSNAGALLKNNDTETQVQPVVIGVPLNIGPLINALQAIKPPEATPTAQPAATPKPTETPPYEPAPTSTPRPTHTPTNTPSPTARPPEPTKTPELVKTYPELKAIGVLMANFKLSNTVEERTLAGEGSTQRYGQWKANYVEPTKDGGIDVVAHGDYQPVEGHRLSEGRGYGMLISASFKDYATFNGLMETDKKVQKKNGLSPWDIDGNGIVVDATAATDGDEDMAFAAILAYADTKNEMYKNYAVNKINALMNNVVEQDTFIVKPGDTWGGSNPNQNAINPSYFRPFYYKVFSEFTGDNRWKKVLDKQYEITNLTADPKTGLQPDWAKTTGGPSSVPGLGHDFAWDAARYPLFVGMDAIATQDPRALEQLRKMNKTFKSDGPGEGSGRKLSGEVLDTTPNAVFAGPVAAAAVIDNDQAYRTGTIKQLNGLGKTYYDQSLEIISELTINGAVFESLLNNK